MIDYLIVTFIRDEYEAVRELFIDSRQETTSGVAGTTRVIEVATCNGEAVNVAIARIAREGNVSAVDGVLNLIDEQHPRIVLAIGIAGAVPTNDIFLGDVLLVNDVHNMTLGAETPEGREEATSSTHITNEVKEFVANVTSGDLLSWQERMSSVERPMVGEIGRQWTDDDEWNERINQALDANKDRVLPEIVDGVIASSDHLVKSQDFMEQRLLVDRGILANDMESAGVATACVRKSVPLMIIRGVSDIVGHERSDEWKRYACITAAGCAWELVRLDCIETIESRLNAGQQVLSNSTARIIQSLEEALSRVKTGPTNEYGSTCRKAFSLFCGLPKELKPRWAPELFDTLDRPMKFLGDKQLVLEVAEACIASCSGKNLDDRTAECQARARICGTSWVYQRTEKLGLAEEEAQLSLRISEGLRSKENLAYCKKCLGRLKRLRAESKTNSTVKTILFEESVESLKDAITEFSSLDNYGPDHPEVGDCSSLLGRTYLSAGNIRLAQECTKKARERIDVDSKDYLDLRILEGELWLVLEKNEQALEAFEEVIDLMSEHDYQVSEIVARAHLQRAKTLLGMGRKSAAETAFSKAQSIWERYGEDSFAAEAEWGTILVSGKLALRIRRLLEAEETIIRCGAVRLFNEQQSNRNRRVIAQRVGGDIIVWKNLIKEAQRLHALRSGSSKSS